MANSLGTLTPVLVAQEALQVLTDRFPVINSFVTDFSNDAVLYGQTVYSRLPQLPAASDFDSVNGYVPQSGILQDVPVTLNKFRNTSLSFTDAELSSTNLNLVEQFASALASSVGNDIMNGVAALFTSGNFASSVTTSGSALTRVNSVVAARKVLEANKSPENDRFFITSPTAEADLLSDESIVKLTWGAQGVSEAGIPNLHGFSFGNYTSMPTAGNLQAVALQKNAVVIASRPPYDPESSLGVPIPGIVKNVVDPRTGLTIQVRMSYDIGKGRLQVTYAWQYGVAVGASANLVRITK